MDTARFYGKSKIEALLAGFPTYYCQWPDFKKIPLLRIWRSKSGLDMRCLSEYRHLGFQHSLLCLLQIETWAISKLSRRFQIHFYFLQSFARGSDKERQSWNQNYNNTRRHQKSTVRVDIVSLAVHIMGPNNLSKDPLSPRVWRMRQKTPVLLQRLFPLQFSISFCGRYFWSWVDKPRWLSPLVGCCWYRFASEEPVAHFHKKKNRNTWPKKSLSPRLFTPHNVPRKICIPESGIALAKNYYPKWVTTALRKKGVLRKRKDMRLRRG